MASLVLAAVSLFAAQDSFEVASVKRNTSLANNSLLRVLPGGRLTATNFNVRQLILFAWQLAPFQVTGGPAWMSSDGYDIIAKLEGNPQPVEPGTGRVDPRQMAVRNLLAERFKLKTHRETREMDIYALVMAKPGGAPGPTLKPTVKDCGGGADCGISGGNGRLRFAGLNSTMIAQSFTQLAGRMVVDRTGLSGQWDFELTFTSQVRADAANPDVPDFFTAIQEQLGLKLESTKGPVEMFVIDSVERPTED